MSAGAAPPDERPRAPRGLRRFVRTAGEAASERCEMCAAPLPTSGHRHLVDTRERALACACVPCALLFDRPGAAHGRFRVVPDRVLREPGDGPGPEVWERLGIPVGVAFLLRTAESDRRVAVYPSPAGATESTLDTRTWQAALADVRLAALVEPDVEALLLRRDGDRVSCHLVPVDVAYELVGRMRLHWRGFDGGATAQTELQAYFTDIDSRARDARPEDRP